MHTSETDTTQHITIVGAGWAGLAAAIELGTHGRAVMVFESAKHTGGRARSVEAMQYKLDNGQHIMLGAYEHFLGLLQKIGVHESEVLLRLPLKLDSRSCRSGDRFVLHTAKFPAPLHLLWALLSATGLTWRDKLAAIRLWRALEKKHFQLQQDITLDALFRQYQQTQNLVTKLWEPLCIAALNTPVDKASAQVFITVLQKSFSGRRQDSDVLLPKTDLGNIVPEPANLLIDRQGGELRGSTRITALEIGENRLKGVYRDERFIATSRLILATPPAETLRLIRPHPALADIADRLEQFTYEPITTLYLKYPASIRLPSPMLGVLEGTGQWIFDRSLYGQPGVMAVVISTGGPHEGLENDALTNRVHAEISRIIPDLPPPLDTFVIREKRATFSCTPEINRMRPENRTPVSGLWLAGDYTCTNLPATLEGAIQSGVQCAQQILSAD